MELAAVLRVQRKEAVMLKKLMFVTIFGLAAATQLGCAPLAAGVAGAAIGHEVGEEKNDGD